MLESIFNMISASDESDSSDDDSDDSEVVCNAIPSEHKHMDHEFQPKKIHYGYYTKRDSWDDSKMEVYEKFWHECKVCEVTCGHHKKTIGKIEIDDDGVTVVE